MGARREGGRTVNDDDALDLARLVMKYTARALLEKVTPEAERDKRRPGAREGEVNMDTLGDALPREMARVRDRLIPVYLSIGPAGAIALAMMRHDLDMAAKAMAEGDVAAMMRAYAALKDYEL